MIPYAVKSLGGDFETDREKTLMIGDTWFDAKGARLCNVDFIGVLYGYGTYESMKAEEATMFAETPSEILKHINR